jgi:hypothetical protein
MKINTNIASKSKDKGAVQKPRRSTDKGFEQKAAGV